MHRFNNCLKIAVLNVLTFISLPLFGQNNIQINLGPDEIGENQFWTITVTVKNEALKSYDNFPDIEGFRKRGTSTNSQTSIINGQISSSQGVTMSYQPLKQGTVSVSPFKMKINGQSFSVVGKKVKVGPAAQDRNNDPLKRRLLLHPQTRVHFHQRNHTSGRDQKGF